MDTEDVVLNYKGFKPTQTAENQLKIVTDRLHDEAPSDSFLNATFLKSTGNKYRGFIRISFSDGFFFARAADCDLKVVVEKLAEAVRSQLVRWKTMRFARGLYGRQSY